MSDEVTVVAANNVSNSLLKNRRFDELVPFARRQVDVARRALGDRHFESLQAANILAAGLTLNPASSRSDLLEAVAIYEEVIPKMRHVLGPQHPRVVTAVSQLQIACQMAALF